MKNKLMKGVDVSQFNGSVDFKAIKEAGNDFVIIRLAGANSSGIYKDKRVDTNYKKAIESGLHIGFYYCGNASDPRRYIERVNFVASVCPETNIAPIDDDAKSEIFMQMCFGMTSFSEVKDADVNKALRDWLSAEQLALLKYLAPKTVEFPNRKRPCVIRYDASAKRAVISSFFRDFYTFDTKKVRICDGKIAPTFELLAPSGRPVQTTQNLDEFWNTSWQAVKKELKARYPKHFKSDDIR